MDIKKDKNSRWYDVKLVPDKYKLAKEDRPQNIDGQVCDSVPVIDLAKHRQAVEAILMASQEFGFFKVINHDVPIKTIVDAMNVLKEFHEMPSKEAIRGSHKKGWAHQDNSTKDGVYLWRESLKHPCHPLEECIKLWPPKPTKYSEVIQSYLQEIQKLSENILEMIAEGLGLEPEYIKDTSEVKLLASNFYPPCPDPSLTIGLPAHKDPSLITILYQSDSTGLQILKDGQWVNVGTTQNSFVVNIGNQLEIISNGKLKSIEHRVLNSTKARISIAIHVNPSTNCLIEPAKVLVNESEPARYKASLYGEYVNSNNAFGDYTAALYADSRISES
uniref:hyoscyamine 6-dioxygenase-like n=1 Tax=Erigeron canadensis TaxID=72917 RepID=UPI001CB92FCA|nr:hyoscyamine 6-dioxygenase-like [Erigeron canadensis]